MYSSLFYAFDLHFLARLEDEYREFGVLKAVGLYDKDIIKLYIAKYTLIAFVGSLSGYSLFPFFKRDIIRRYSLIYGACKIKKGIDGAF